MRYVNILLCLLMLVFIAVQFNDPDGPIWMLIYAVPAVWTAIAVFRPLWLRQTVAQAILLSCITAAVVGMIYYWPTTPRWWASEVWYETETAREGMGMMIVAIVLFIVWLSRSPKAEPPR